MKRIPKEKLIVRPSMKLSYAGSDLWFEELDALSIHTDVLREKFIKDMDTIRRPSAPGLVAFNLNETLVDSQIADLFAEGLADARHLRRVVFIGLNGRGKRLVREALSRTEPTYTTAFIDDCEKAKGFLVGLD